MQQTHRRHGFNPWVGKLSWRRKWQPTPVFLPGESHGQRSLVGYSLQGCKEVDTTEWLSRHSSSLYSCFIDISLELPLYPRAGNNPLSFVSNTVPWTLDTGFKTSRLVPLIKIVPDSNSQPLIMNYGISQMNSSNFQFICAFAFLLSTAFQDQKCKRIWSDTKSFRHIGDHIHSALQFYRERF